MGERVDSVARPARCWPYDARHFARHILPTPVARPPPFPPVFLCPRICPLGVLLGSTRLLVGLLPGRVWGGGGRPMLALVPPCGSFHTGGLMHALPVRV